MEELKEKLNSLVAELAADEQEILETRLANLISVYPFNEYEFIITSLVGLGKLTLSEYYEIRDDYIEQSKYLHIFEIGSPTGFGQLWAQGHLKELVPELETPSKKNDVKYSRDYDLVLPAIDGNMVRIEVKASRAVDKKSSKPLYIKALAYANKHSFLMNFQQLKPAHCDVFVWVAVWRDLIKYWVLSSKEVETSKRYQKIHHRGNVGEGQLHITDNNVTEFQIYEVKPNELKEAIVRAYERQLGKSV